MKWTRRKSGETRCTIRIELHVPRDMVKWLTEHGFRTEQSALGFVRRHPELADGWHTLAAIAATAKGVSVIHVDDAQMFEPDGEAIYDGAMVVFG